MRQTIKLLLILMVAATSSRQILWSQQQVQFERALLLEETQGRLEEAIALYQQIVEGSDDESLAAQAQLHIGICYERLGREEAAKAYQAVIDSYPSQGELTRQARQRLAALLRASESALPSAPTARKVWSGPPDMFGAVSPDGRWVSFANWDTGNLGVHDLQTGESRDVTTDGSWGDSDYNFAETSHWSPDGRQLAYTRWVNGFYELRLIGIEGGSSRLLYRDAAIWGPYEGGWSPDGSSISLTLARNDNTHQLAILSVPDGAVRSLKTTDWRWPAAHEFSPDGKYFAFEFPPQEESPNRDIYLMASDGNREVHLIEHQADEAFMGWTPDGSVLFSSDRTGAYGLWMIRTRNGDPDSVPVLIQPHLGEVFSLGTTQDGSFYYGVNGGGGLDAFQVEIDPKTGAVTGTPRPVSESRLGRTRMLAWSSDGRSLAYLSRRGPGHSVVVRSLDAGREREFPVRSRPDWFRWFPDSDSLLFVRLLGEGHGVYRVPLGAPDSEELLLEADLLEQGPLAALTDGGRTLIYLKVEVVREGNQQRYSSMSLVRRDFETGQEAVLYQRPEDDLSPVFAVSSDGRRMAFRAGPISGTHKIVGLSTQGGIPQHLADLSYQGTPIEIIRPDSLVWTRDGRYLLFNGTINLAGQRTEQLWRIPAAGGTPEPAFANARFEGGGPWGSKGPHSIRYLQMSPDGGQLGFRARYDPITPDAVWVLEHFLPDTVPR